MNGRSFAISGAAGALALVLAACNQTGSSSPIPGTPQPTDAPATACGAHKVAPFVGREATPTVRAEVTRLVGERQIRWIGPNDAVTMDFIPSRLNMMLDERDVITEARCG